MHRDVAITCPKAVEPPNSFQSNLIESEPLSLFHEVIRSGGLIMRLGTISQLMLGVSALAFAAPAFAQSNTTASSSHNSASSAPPVSEVMVTATRRSAPLQSVPVSVDVVSGDQIQKANLKGVRDLQYLSPSVYVTTANGASIAIRGVGTTSTNNGTEQAVGLVVDGVVMGF